MTSHPPHGINDVDYEAIEAAVTETVRGRWFLNEFARRNRASEMRQLLEAMARLETTVASQAQPALPSADPSVRLLIQRIKEIAAQLDGLSRDMRESGVDERFCAAADLQARAVAGMMRNTVPGGPLPALKVAPPRPSLAGARLDEPPAPPAGAVPQRPDEPPPPASPATDAPRDPRLAALSGFDDLPLAKKLALFT